jgi:hypothetical protein
MARIARLVATGCLRMNSRFVATMQQRGSPASIRWMDGATNDIMMSISPAANPEYCLEASV